MLQQRSQSLSLSLYDAARIICRTTTPSADQIGRVRHEFECGLLAGRRAGKDNWMTSDSSVAEYMARRSLHKQSARRNAAARPNSDEGQQDHWRKPDELKAVYREVLCEYFLAVLMRRRSRTASRGFERAVLAGQIGLLATMLLGIVVAVRSSILPSIPERVVVENWLAQNVPRYQVGQWFPTQPSPKGDGLLVRVQYRYFASSHKSVDTDRVFLVQGDQITSVDSEVP